MGLEIGAGKVGIMNGYVVDLFFAFVFSLCFVSYGIAESEVLENPRSAVAGGVPAGAVLERNDGVDVAYVKFTQVYGRVVIHVKIINLAPGVYGFGIYKAHKCVPPFDSVGSYYDSTFFGNSGSSVQKIHAGELPNIFVPKNGKAEIDMISRDLTVVDILSGQYVTAVDESPRDYKVVGEGSKKHIACGEIIPLID